MRGRRIPCFSQPATPSIDVKPDRQSGNEPLRMLALQRVGPGPGWVIQE